MLKMQERKCFKIMSRCSLNALIFYLTQNVYFVVLLYLTVVEKKMQLYLFLLGMMIRPP